MRTIGDDPFVTYDGLRLELRKVDVKVGSRLLTAV